MSKHEIVDEFHRFAPRNSPPRRVTTNDFENLWQCDLVEIIPYTRENKCFKYLRRVIDVFSKYTSNEHVITKSGPNVTTAF